MADDEGGSRESILALAAEAAKRPEDPNAPGKFALSTLVTLAVGAVGLLVCLILVRVGLGPNTFLAGLGAAVMGVVTVAGLLKVLYEAVQTSPRDRTTPEKAIKAYFGSLKQLRWDAAASCLSWAAKRGTEIVRPAMPDVDLAEARFRISSEKELADYWYDFVGRFKSRGSRSLSCRAASTKQISDDVAYVVVEARVTIDLRTAALGGEARSRREFLSSVNAVSCSGRWPVYRRDGMWYLLSAGFPGDARVMRA